MHNFDEFADDYVSINDQYTSFFGEKTDYFANYKAAYLAKLFGAGFKGRILDFGCGIGLVTNRLTTLLPSATIDGIDSSAASIARARTEVPSDSNIHYYQSESELAGRYDGILMANVLHHVEPADRIDVMRRALDLLDRGGRLVVFEHNTWNPLVMNIVTRHPFDRDAVFLSPRAAGKLMRDVGLAPRIDFIVFFPAFLRVFRFLEPSLRLLPIGGQYVCVGKKD